MAPADGAGRWIVSEGLKSFHTDGTAEAEVWLGYRHLAPRYEDWAFLTGASAVKPPPCQPQLVRDFTTYNTDVVWYFGRPNDWRPPPPLPQPLPDGLGQPPKVTQLGLNWVGDLAVQFEVNAESDRGEIIVALVKGGHQFSCRFNMATGAAVLQVPGVDGFHPSADAFRGPGKHRVRFANVDQQLLLWIDGRLVAFDGPTTYEFEDVDTRVPNREDLAPVRIGSRGAAASVQHLSVFRDIYYIAQRADTPNAVPPPTDFDRGDPVYPFHNATVASVAQFFSDPRQWDVFGQRQSVVFQLGEDQFFMLGDNSAASKDSRLWDGDQFYVERDLLVGKALVVYWPHSWNHVPGTRIPFPMFPNFSRMRLVR